jgi:hypothetical protein
MPGCRPHIIDGPSICEALRIKIMLIAVLTGLYKLSLPEDRWTPTDSTPNRPKSLDKNHP